MGIYHDQVAKMLYGSNEQYAAYGWIIDVDYLDRTATNETVGPSEIDPAIMAALETVKSSGERFKMYDDDGELYYAGRIIIDENHPDHEGEEEFGPLYDFGTPMAGCTDIRYLVNGKWTSL